MEKRLASSQEIVYDDVFHFKTFYRLVHEWLLEEGYKDLAGLKEGDEYYERFYMDRNFAQYGTKEIWVFWKAYKPTTTSSTYFRNHFDIKFHILNMKDVELVHEGRKVQAHRGEVTVYIKAYLEMDYAGWWEKQPKLIKQLDTLFRKRLYKNEIKTKEIDLYRDSYRLATTIKSYLRQKHFLMEPEPFHPRAT